LVDRQGVRITVPGHGAVTVDVPRRGAFYVVDESTDAVESVGL
jgi:proline racemase